MTARRAFTEREAAAYVGLSARTLRELRAKDQRRAERGAALEGPAWRRLGSRIRYYIENLDAFLEQAPRLGTCDSKVTATSGVEAGRRHARGVGSDAP